MKFLLNQDISSISSLSYETITESLTANMIMTSRGELCVFKPEEKISQVLATMEEKNYDIAPLYENGVIESFVERETVRKQNPSLPCKKVATHISIRHVISEQTKIEKLLGLFIQQDFFFVIGQKEITGIVTYADLNKRAVKVLFYLLISELETRLLQMIKRRFPKIEDCLAYLTAKQRGDIKKNLKETKKGNTDVSIEQYLSTSHIIRIIVKDSVLRGQLKFSSRKQAERNLNSLVEIRNKTMHPRPLMNQKDDFKLLKRKYDIISDLLKLVQGTHS